jgi:hypothetical protein
MDIETYKSEQVRATQELKQQKMANCGGKEKQILVDFIYHPSTPIL